MHRSERLKNIFRKRWLDFHEVVPFRIGRDKLQLLDFTESNQSLTDDILNNTDKFSEWIDTQLQQSNAVYGIGGYAEHRTIYNRSNHFNSPAHGEEPRRLHLGIDIWGKANTPVMAPLMGTVHSFAYNDHFGDYGATIILAHELEGISFHTLYGHLSLHSISHLVEGELIKKGKVFAELGIPAENGNWPPHLHFQVIIDMKDAKGDYPGVCKFSERDKWLLNSPDPDEILNMVHFIQPEKSLASSEK